ncbi:hypothetical protein [Catenulispora pinisilvae]|uniref:hypothetical protein n=1 Tax=Catenulispora pinisilvae TaxID=2705253 RepID=UPI001891AA02|nr:hypothetical protein [Catenulispora pinisilvae]
MGVGVTGIDMDAARGRPEQIGDELFWGVINQLRDREWICRLQASGQGVDSDPPVAMRVCWRGNPSDAEQLRLVRWALESSQITVGEAGHQILEKMRAELDFDIAEARTRYAQAQQAREDDDRRHAEAVSAYQTLPWWRRRRAPRPRR